MAMTARVKDELSRLTVTKPCCRKAEVATTLRFAGGLHIVGGRIVVEAELDTAATARRLRKDISEVYGHSSEIVVLSAGGLRRGSRYVVGVSQDGAPTTRCWPGRSAVCGARYGPPPTGWPTSTMPTCAVPHVQPLRPAPGSSARWRSWAPTFRTTCARPASCVWSTRKPLWKSSASSLTRR